VIATTDTSGLIAIACSVLRLLPPIRLRELSGFVRLKFVCSQSLSMLGGTLVLSSGVRLFLLRAGDGH
jgi:hypothetical protein